MKDLSKITTKDNRLYIRYNRGYLPSRIEVFKNIKTISAAKKIINKRNRKSILEAVFFDNNNESFKAHI